MPDHAADLEGRSLVKAAPIMALRTVILAGLIFAAVSIQPTEPVDTVSIIIVVVMVLIIWGALFGLVFWWQIRRIDRARHPQAQTIEALAIVFVLFLAIFAKTYHIISQAYPDAFTQEMDFFASLYLSMTVLSTVGFGDIAPVMPLARGVVMVQMVMDLVLLGVAVRVLVEKGTKAMSRRRVPRDSFDSQEATSQEPSDSESRS